MFLDVKYFVILIWCYRLFVFVAGSGGRGGAEAGRGQGGRLEGGEGAFGT